MAATAREGRAETNRLKWSIHPAYPGPRGAIVPAQPPLYHGPVVLR
jgi:hypothetical protein